MMLEVNKLICIINRLLSKQRELCRKINNLEKRIEVLSSVDDNTLIDIQETMEKIMNITQKFEGLTEEIVIEETKTSSSP